LGHVGFWILDFRLWIVLPRRFVRTRASLVRQPLGLHKVPISHTCSLPSASLNPPCAIENPKANKRKSGYFGFWILDFGLFWATVFGQAGRL
jgi:hypothetical protein